MLLDEAGSEVLVANAAPDAQVAVHVRGAALRPADAPPQSLARWSFPLVPGRVELRPAFGDPAFIEVVDAGQITKWDVSFELAGAAGVPRTLRREMIYGEAGWGRAANRIAPVVSATYVGSDPLCSPAAMGWFAFESLTPDVCELVPLLPAESGTYVLYEGAFTVGKAAKLSKDGTCTLRLSAPGFAAGAGFSSSLSAGFQNVHLLRE